MTSGDEIKYQQTLLVLAQKQKEIDKLENKLSTQQKQIGYLTKDLEQKALQLVESEKLQTQLHTWQSVVDELAHSINTDVYIAVNQLSRYRDDPRINKAFHHIKQIRDLTNLLMTYIKRNEITLSGEMETIGIKECIEEQIALIKDGISTLRLSEDEHIDRLLELEIIVEGDENTSVYIQKEFKDALPLIMKDLLRNAFKNTDETEPKVTVTFTSIDGGVSISIMNNRAIHESFRDWFNGASLIDPEMMSKSGKVGLRVIKMWTELLNIGAVLTPDYNLKTTTATITLPGRIIV